MPTHEINNTYKIQVHKDVAFGEATIGFGTDKAATRALLLDVYLPIINSVSGPHDERGHAVGTSSRPALILAHGGAYHRGSKEDDLVEQDGHRNTTVAEYCQAFAEKGYVCFSVGYRLTQELAAPLAQPMKRTRGAIPRGRIDYVRELLGLAPATDQELLNGVEGATSDVADALRFVQANAGQWGVDPKRIALGGFSSGAFSAIYAAYALGAQAAAIVSLSGGIEPEDADYYIQGDIHGGVHGGRGQPPVLLFVSEFDLPGIREKTLTLADRAEKVGLGVQLYHVPQKPHFYERHTEVVLERTNQANVASAGTLETVVSAFLKRALEPAKANVALDALATT
jgi:acetyl esterase/lipase